MTTNMQLVAPMENYEVERLRRLWALSRDYGDWETMRSCFHDDAYIEVLWYSGSVDGFIEATKKNAAKRKPEERSKHWLGSTRSWINGERALVESDAQIQNRNYVDGYLLDCTSWCRFLDRVERRDGSWKILSWVCFFDKDRLDPVIPYSVPKEFYDGVKLEGRESGFAFMRYRQKKVGRTTIENLMLGGSDEELEAWKDSRAWLALTPAQKA